MDAAKTNKQEERRTMMLNGKISSLIPLMAIPTMVSMLVTSFYNMADTYFVSSLGTEATAAVGVNSSIDSFIMMAGSALAVGANSYISRLLGAKQDKKASQVLSTAFFTALAIGLVFGIIGLTNLYGMVKLLGATETVAPYAETYASWVLCVAPFMAASFVMNQCLRAEGSAIFSMIGMTFGAVLNIALDPLFIFVFHWGIAGAASATAISKVVSFGILLFPYLKKNSLLHLSIRNIKYSKDIVSEILKMGSPSLFRTGLATLASIITNNMAGVYGDSVLAAISVVNRVMMFMTSAVLGFGQGYQPVAGYNWGACRYDRVWEAFKFSAVAGTAVITGASAIIALLAPQIISAFTTGDATMVAIGAFSIRLQCAVMPAHAFGIVVNMTYAALGRAKGAFVQGIARQGICFLPVIFILPVFFNEWGIAAAQGAADALTLVLSVPLAILFIRDIRVKMKEQAAGSLN